MIAASSDSAHPVTANARAMHPDETRRRNLRTGLALAAIALTFLLAFLLRRYFE
jgi:hypothetical protein